MKLVSIRAKAGLAALALAAAAVPAFAQTTASASAALVRYELVDLDLNDGVTPWLSFEDSWGASSQAVIFPGSSQYPTPLAESTNWGWGLAAVQAGQYSARAQAGMDGIWSTAAAGGPNLVYSTALTVHDFLLSPNTSVTFFFDTDLDTSPGDSGSLAAAGMMVTFGGKAFSQTDLTVSDGKSFSGDLTAFGDAHGADAVEGRVWMETYTAIHAAAPVPEPAAPAMLLGGLGLLAAAGWRRIR